jgi:hypothetical protein
MAKNWKRTVAAAKAEESSAWSMIWAMAEEAFDRDPTYKNITSGPIIEEIRLELVDAGVELAWHTIRNRAVVGKMAHSATKRDSNTLRSVPWSVVFTACSVGATAEATADLIRRCRLEGTQPTAAVVRTEFSTTSSTTSSTGDSSRSEFTDDKVISAAAVIASHYVAKEAGKYAPSPMARLAMTLLGQMLIGEVVVTDWDKEMKDLVATEGGAG